MHHYTTTPLTYEGYPPVRVVLKYLLFAFLGALLIVMQSLPLLIATALGFVMVLALQERVRMLERASSCTARTNDNHWVCDGGSFPGRQTKEHVSVSSPRVIDGGSLERLPH